MAAISPGPLSTGEGIVFNVRDEYRTWEEDKKTSPGEWKLKDPGVPDKRLIIMDEELAAGLRCSKREGNTLSPALRSFWDSGCVQPLTKSSPTRTTNAHVNIVAHITLEELERTLGEVELFNGFANRFLWVLARRSRLISRPSPMPAEELLKLQAVLLDRLKFAHSAGLMTLDDSAYELWDRVYPSLAMERGGLFGAVVGRSEAQVQRLAMIYALLDREAVIGIKHLEAALAFWNYCEASAAYIFKGRQADPLQEKILAALKASPHPVTATELHRALGNSYSQDQMKKALGSLTSSGIVIHEKEATKTKPRNIFRLNEKTEFFEHISSAGEPSENSDHSPECERRPEEENLPAVLALPEGGAR
ncbi:DUF3987 domain-containing protein [Fundidesulfovibrio soli]|uniref:DUF3987 domain-containing protein n=1 Tax=Fundidesulfovibrio soli TaxID=2922716 RepID=UPI001FAFC0FC|nr:DUF3987 domain-containing protein [Fundidesulfovibrio soli]